MGGMKIKKGDKVEVLTGKYRGQQGRILKAFPQDEKVIVEGVNMIKRHTRPSQENPQGGIIHREARINASNVGVVCGGCGKVVRVAYLVDDSGIKKRICRKCGVEMD